MSTDSHNLNLAANQSMWRFTVSEINELFRLIPKREIISRVDVLLGNYDDGGIDRSCVEAACNDDSGYFCFYRFERGSQLIGGATEIHDRYICVSSGEHEFQFDNGTVNVFGNAQQITFPDRNFIYVGPMVSEIKKLVACLVAEFINENFDHAVLLNSETSRVIGQYLFDLVAGI